MKTKIHKIFIGILTFLGVVHTVLTPASYNKFDLNALWFAGTGLGLIFLGLLNFSSLKSKEVLVKAFCFISNLLYIIFTFLVLFFLIKEPQAYIVIIVLIALFILNTKDLFKTIKANKSN